MTLQDNNISQDECYRTYNNTVHRTNTVFLKLKLMLWTSINICIFI